MIHLHTHSKYSVSDALPSSEQYAKKAGEGSSLALTDHDSMGGVIDHRNACQKHGVKPIYGVEATLDGGRHHLTLLAMNSRGLKNIYSLLKSDKTLGDLENCSGEVIALSGDLKGAIPQSILRNDKESLNHFLSEYQRIFKDRFFLEKIDHGLREQKIVNEVLEGLDVPSVRTNDVHYLSEKDARAHGILMCDKLNKRADLDWIMAHGLTSAYLCDLPECELTKEIAEACNVDLNLGNIYLPNFEFPSSFESESDYFRYIIRQSLKKKGLVKEPYLSRAKEEIEIIEKMGYVGYFLIVWDFIKYAHSENIPVGPGRGSGGGSLVAYLMEITNVNPITYDLLFERFLNPARVSMPDFDIDFCQLRRGEVIEYVKNKYGEECVGGIATFGELKARAAWKTAARVMSVPPFQQDAFSKLLPSTLDSETLQDIFDEDGKLNPEIDAKYEKLKIAISYYPGYRDVNKMAREIEGGYKNVSKHAAGILISDDLLEKYIPVWDLRKEDSPVDLDDEISLLSQFSMGDAEKAGLVKFDFLGLKELTVIDYAVKLIKKEHGIDIDPENLPLDDEKTYELLSSGRTLGIFQVSGHGLAHFMGMLKPNNINDIIAAVALYRPGPMDYKGGMHLEYVMRKNGQSEIVYPHEDLKPILEDTYGIIVYQEQVMQLARAVAGYSLGEADILRRAMGKKKKKEMDSQRYKFEKGMKDRGYSAELTNDMWEQIETFSRYGFNKSHAAAYGLITYQTAWLKANYMPELLAAQMQVRSGKLDKVSAFIDDAKYFGIEVVEPDVQFGNKNFTTKDGRVYVGMNSIKNINDDVAKKIEMEAPFDDLTDFFMRVPLTKKDLDGLLYSGAMDSLLKADTMVKKRHKRSELASQYKRFLPLKKKGQSGQTEMFKIHIELLEGHAESILTRRGMLDLEHEYLERYRSGHPVDPYKKRARVRGADNICDVTTVGSYSICGIIKEVKEITTYKNDLMAFVQVQDDTGTIDITVFPDDYEPKTFETKKILYMTINTDYYKDRLSSNLEFMEVM